MEGNGLFDETVLMGDQCGAQGRQLLVSLEFAEALCGFDQAFGHVSVVRTFGAAWVAD